MVVPCCSTRTPSARSTTLCTPKKLRTRSRLDLIEAPDHEGEHDDRREGERAGQQRRRQRQHQERAETPIERLVGQAIVEPDRRHHDDRGRDDEGRAPTSSVLPAVWRASAPGRHRIASTIRIGYSAIHENTCGAMSAGADAADHAAGGHPHVERR